MNKAQDQRRWWTSLRVRLAALVSIAILPLGIVAVFQTAAVVREAQALERTALMSRTLRAVSTERALLRRAYGSAEALAVAAKSVGSETPLCGTIMRNFVAENDTIVFAGFIDAFGFMQCSSTGDTQDFSDFDDWQSFVADPRPMIAFNPQGALSGRPVMIATMPVFDADGQFLGGASVSISDALLGTAQDPEFDGVRLALLDGEGAVLAASVEPEQIARFGFVPADLVITETGFTRDVTTRDGRTDLAVLVPLIADRVYVLGLYEAGTQAQSVSFLGTGAPLFPILMWAIALCVAIFAMDRLVLRHLREVRARMASFSFEDPGDSFAMLESAPDEITEIADTYNRMVDRILGDRTELSEALAEKELLLREVHHRVKNNLQLIASMINIQIRSVPDGESRRVLRRMQDRVMGLSSIHKALYSGNTLARVRADRLLHDVLQSTLSIGLPPGQGVETRMQFDRLSLEPDHAVPLTLLASELTTNAVKYVGRPNTGPPMIRLKLEWRERDVVLTVENTLGRVVQEEDGAQGTGLGAQLISAFVSQLGATIDVDHDAELHKTTVICPGLAAETVDDEEDTDEDDADAPEIELPRAS
ncbi:sensor histidine kinase [Gymnodinialimonas ulvae]|uniref:sensor histidine kinase n=1 Tax=Gymnodinialimonas ulvae TaxID=3126504 RepID=UPI0030B1CEB2